MSICLVVRIECFSRLSYSCGYRKLIVSTWWWSDMLCLGNEASSAIGLDALTTINPIDSLYKLCLLWHWLQSYCLCLWKVASSPVPLHKHLSVYSDRCLCRLSCLHRRFTALLYLELAVIHSMSAVAFLQRHNCSNIWDHSSPFSSWGNSEVTGSAVLFKRINEAKHLTLPGSTYRKT